MDRVGSWHTGFFRPILQCFVTKSRYLQKSVYVPLELCPKLWTEKISPRQVDRLNVLSTKLDKGGRSESDKLDRCRSTKLTLPATVGGWFISLIAHLCLQHDSVARVHLRQLIVVDDMMTDMLVDY